MMPVPWFEADCPVLRMTEIAIGEPNTVCMIGFADCSDGTVLPTMVFGDCESDLCGCVDSACDCDSPNLNPDPVDPADPDPVDPDPVDPVDPVDPTDPGAGSDPTNPAQTGPGANPNPAVPSPENATTVRQVVKPAVLGQPLTFDDRILRPNQSLEGKTIRIANAVQEDPSTDLIKVPSEVNVERVTSVRFGPGVKFTEEAFYGLFELKTVAPVKYTVNGMEFSIPTDKKFHIAIRLKSEPKELSNLGRSYRDLIRSDSKESPQEGVITLDGVQYHAIGRK